MASSAKIVRFSNEARGSLLQALETAVRLVAPTFGPYPRAVLVEKTGQAPAFAGSALEVLKALEVEDRVENAVLSMVRDAAERIRSDAGDGVATALLLTHAIVRNARRALGAGADAQAVARGISEAEMLARKGLKPVPVKRLDQIHAVARTAATDASVPPLIESIAEDLSRGSAVVVEDSKQIETTVSRIEGFQFDRGMASAHFVNKEETGEVIMERPLVLLYEPKISSVQELAPFLERAAAAQRPLLMIVGGIDPEPIATLVVNRLRGALHACAVVTPGADRIREELLLDLGAMTGAEPILQTAPAPLADVTLEQLGSADRVLVDKESTTLTLQQAAPKLQEHLDRLKHSLEHHDMTLGERDDLQDRIMRLSGRIVQIFVGAPTESALQVRKNDVQAAVRAVRGAISGGVVPGGGAALRDASRELRSSSDNPDVRAGFEAFRDALTIPMKRIVESSGRHPASILERPGAFNVVTGREDDGLIDPLPVLTTAMRAAASLASVLITTEAVVVETSRIDPYIPPGIDKAWEASKEMRG